VIVPLIVSIVRRVIVPPIDAEPAAVIKLPLKRRLPFFEWKGHPLEEYWEYTLNAFTWPDDNGKSQGIEIIVNDGGDMTLLIHERKKAEDLFLKDRKRTGSDVGDHDNEKKNVTGSEDNEDPTSYDEAEGENNDNFNDDDQADKRLHLMIPRKE